MKATPVVLTSVADAGEHDQTTLLGRRYLRNTAHRLARRLRRQ